MDLRMPVMERDRGDRTIRADETPRPAPLGPIIRAVGEHGAHGPGGQPPKAGADGHLASR